MALRFLADHCIANSIVWALKQQGHDTTRLRDVLSSDAPDSQVIAKAQELNAILLTLNGDFADIVTYPPVNYKGIVALQMRNRPQLIPQLMSRLISYLTLHPLDEEYFGKLFIVEVNRIRVRE